MRDDVTTADHRSVEVVLRWGGLVTDVKRMKAPLRFSVGMHADDELFVPVDGASWDLITSSSSGCAVRFKHGMSGTITRGGQVVPLSSSGAMHDGDALAVPLTDETVVTIAVGQHSLQVQTVAKSRPVWLPPMFDALWANAALITVFMSAALLAAMFFYPVGMNDLDDDLLTNPARFQTFVIKPTTKHNAFLAALNVQAQVVVDAAPASGKSLAPTKRDGPVDSARSAASDEDVVAGKMEALFGSDAVASVFRGAAGIALNEAVGQLKGVKVAGGNGVGSLGLRGGVGIGVEVGVGVGTLGGGAIETNGRSSGDVDYGSVDGGLGSKSDREITMTPGIVCSIGTIDPETIRRVVRDHAGQIRYCYESELARTPGIGGKVTMKWVINADGHVTQASTADTQMNNAAVQACLAARIKTWSFPKPKGGGIVVVNYPFVFKQAG